MIIRELFRFSGTVASPDRVSMFVISTLVRDEHHTVLANERGSGTPRLLRHGHLVRLRNSFPSFRNEGQPRPGYNTMSVAASLIVHRVQRHLNRTCTDTISVPILLGDT